MRITFKRAVKDNDENEFEPPKWYVYMHPGKGDYTIQYIVDGNTGTYEKEKTFVQLIE